MSQATMMIECPYVAEGWISYFACNHPSVFLLAITAAVATISAIIALLTVLSARKGQRIVNSVNFLWDIMRDDNFISASIALGELSKNQDQLSRYGLRANYAPLPIGERSKVDQIRVLISTWEGIALAIKHKGYEEKMLKEALKGTCLKQLDVASPFIESTKSTEPNCAKEWKWLAKKWQS